MFFKNRGKGMELYYFIWPFLDNYKFPDRIIRFTQEDLRTIERVSEEI